MPISANWTSGDVMSRNTLESCTSTVLASAIFSIWVASFASFCLVICIICHPYSDCWSGRPYVGTWSKWFDRAFVVFNLATPRLKKKNCLTSCRVGRSIFALNSHMLSELRYSFRRMNNLILYGLWVGDIGFEDGCLRFPPPPFGFKGSTSYVPHLNKSPLLMLHLRVVDLCM